jgi:hypothetical protein
LILYFSATSLRGRARGRGSVVRCATGLKVCTGVHGDVQSAVHVYHALLHGGSRSQEPWRKLLWPGTTNHAFAMHTTAAGATLLRVLPKYFLMKAHSPAETVPMQGLATGPRPAQPVLPT